MYPRFEMLIFRYKTRFFYEIFDVHRVLLGAEHKFAVIFCLRPRGYGQKWIIKNRPEFLTLYLSRLSRGTL